MHEWLEALQKSAKTTSPGVPAEELRKAETEAGVPLPGELGDLYSAFNGGAFEGEVVLYPLHGEGEQASVLEKTRKMLVGLPVAGVWRFGLKGEHRHLYTARKSALVQQGGDSGKLPEWVQALGDEDWIYATWDDAKSEARFYRSLSNMLSVLVPPVEKEEFGETTFARAIAAVQGALSELDGGEEQAEGKEQAEGREQAEDKEQAEGEAQAGGEVRELEYDYEEELKAADAALAEIDAQLQKPAVIAADRRMEKLSKPAAKKKAPRSEKPEKAPAAKRDTELEKPVVIAAERRMENLKGKAAQEQPAVPRKKAAARTAAKKAPVKKTGAKKAAAKKVPAKKAAAKKVPAKKAAAKKAPAKKAPAKKAPAKKMPAKKAAAKKAPAKKAAAKKAVAKKMPAKKAPSRRGR
jgi:hypothetical protein